VLRRHRLLLEVAEIGLESIIPNHLSLSDDLQLDHQPLLLLLDRHSLCNTTASFAEHVAAGGIAAPDLTISPSSTSTTLVLGGDTPWESSTVNIDIDVGGLCSLVERHESREPTEPMGGSGLVGGQRSILHRPKHQICFRTTTNPCQWCTVPR
jgi:hypothetical protein